MADHDAVICIDDWAPDESAYEKGYYPEGTRDKAVYFSPADAPPPLRPNWRYLLKESRKWTPWQFWMEVIAYRFGDLVGVKVPPAYVGVVHRDEGPVYGALIEWFYSAEERYVEGARLIAPYVPKFDYKKGQPHTLQTIIDAMTALGTPDNAKFAIQHWANVLTFDTLIGNRDRHPENWGLIATPVPSTLRPGEIVRLRFSPAFDNGTAMCYEQQEDHLKDFDNGQHVLRYLTHPKRARHHMGWSLEEYDVGNFFDFMNRFVSRYPDIKPAVASRLTFSGEALRERAAQLPLIEVPETYRLTLPRLELTLAMILRRAAILRETLGTR